MKDLEEMQLINSLIGEIQLIWGCIGWMEYKETE